MVKRMDEAAASHLWSAAGSGASVFAGTIANTIAGPRVLGWHTGSRSAKTTQRSSDAIEGDPSPAILDLGCRTCGRDLCHFRALGHDAVGLDGSKEFVAMARASSGCDVLHQDFLAMALPKTRFHGVFANASLFHVPSQELPRVLRELNAALRAGGVLFSSNPRGNNEEGLSDSRYCCFFNLETWRAYVTAAGFSEIRHYYRPPGRPRDEQPWLATVWRKE